MNRVVSRPPAQGRPVMFVIALLGVTLIASAVAGLWNGLRYSLLGTAATGKVLEYHRTASRSASVVGDVQVSLPGVPPFPQEVDDSLATQEWAVGGTVRLRCLHEATWSCRVDSPADRYLWPTVCFVAGVGCLLWISTRWALSRRGTSPQAERAAPPTPKRKVARKPAADMTLGNPKVPLVLRVALNLVMAYLLSWQTLIASFVLGGAGLFLMLGWHSSGLEHSGEYKAFTAHAQARITESWLALDFDAAQIRNPANWSASTQAEACMVVEYGESWGAPVRQAFCGNRFAFQRYTYGWPDLGALTRGVPFVWQRDARGFAVPEIRLDSTAYDWLAAHPPDFLARSEYHPRTALDGVLLSLDLPVEAAVVGWAAPSDFVPVSYDPQRPTSVLPTAVMEERRGDSVHPVALIFLLMGGGTFFVGMSLLPLTADLEPWLRRVISFALLCTLPWWSLYFPRALGRLNGQIAELFAGIYGDIDPTGRLVASAPEAAAQFRGRRLVWRLEDSVYADTLGKLTLTAPPKPFGKGDAALVALTDAATARVRRLDAVSRVDLYAGLLRLHRAARKDTTKLFVPAAKQLVEGGWPDSGGKEAAERFLRYVE